MSWRTILSWEIPAIQQAKRGELWQITVVYKDMPGRVDLGPTHYTLVVRRKDSKRIQGVPWAVGHFNTLEEVEQEAKTTHGLTTGGAFDFDEITDAVRIQ
jgi:hypothetical protein